MSVQSVCIFLTRLCRIITAISLSNVFVKHMAPHFFLDTISCGWLVTSLGAKLVLPVYAYVWRIIFFIYMYKYDYFYITLFLWYLKQTGKEIPQFYLVFRLKLRTVKNWIYFILNYLTFYSEFLTDLICSKLHLNASVCIHTNNSYLLQVNNQTSHMLYTCIDCNSSFIMKIPINCCFNFSLFFSVIFWTTILVSLSKFLF